MNKILSFIISFLLILFPNSVGLIGTQQSLAFPGFEQINDQFVEAYNTGNYDLIIDVLSKESKERLGNIEEKIDEFFSYIEGGKIVSSGFGGWGPGYDSNYGDYVEQVQTKDFRIQTATNTYLLSITCHIVDTRHPEKVGVEGFTLGTWPETKYIAALYN